MAETNAKRVLSGRYELSDRLGSGGMAEVYLGRDRVLGRTIAVKTLLTQFAGDPHFIARFRREAQSAAALNHPNIVGVYDTGSDDGTHYIVMEYIEGRTLRDVIREEGPLLPERAAELAGDVCAALAFAHSHGIVHRDVKPANIMITKNGELKVTDFGIARAASSETVTQTATVLGTAQYFSPEQAQAGPVDARSDIYSLGVVLYEMLTRQVPFTGSSPVAIAYKHVKEDPILPSRLNADIPGALESIVMKALAKNPDNRYQSAQEMRQDLMRAASGKPVHATPLLPAAEDTRIAAPVATDSTMFIPRTRVAQTSAEVQRKRRLGWTLLTLIMLAIAGIVTWAILSALNNSVGSATLPNVEGQKIDIAEQALRSAGFTEKPNITHEPSDTIAKDIVIRQTPDGGRHPTDTVVNLVVSSGPANTVVPSLVGKTESEAIALLNEKGLKLGKKTLVFSSEDNKGKVIQSNPRAGTEITRGQEVDIAIGKGPETVPVPQVVGDSVADARTELERVGFVVKIEHSTSPSCIFAPSDFVCDQDPNSGDLAPKGSTVTIFTGPGASESPSPTPTET